MTDTTYSLSMEESGARGTYNLNDVLNSDENPPFQIPHGMAWPRGPEAASQRAEILMQAGVEYLRQREAERPVRPYRVLSLDAGGVRSIYSATVLTRLKKEKQNVYEDVDLIAGTSTGAILAMAVACGIEPEKMVNFFRNQGSFLFQQTMLDELRKKIVATYQTENVRKLLLEVFEDRKMGDLQKKVLIPAFDLDTILDDGTRTWKAVFFHNFEKRHKDGQDASFRNEAVVDVILRSMAMPTFFPSYQGYIDGSFCSPNPSMAALAQALDPATGGQKLENIRLISVGAGTSPQYLKGETLDWGEIKWAGHLTSLIIDGDTEVEHYQCSRILKDHYYRVNSVLPVTVGIDDFKKSDILELEAYKADLTRAFLVLSE